MVTGCLVGLSPNRHDLGIPKNNKKYDTTCDPVNTYTIYQAVLNFNNTVRFHLHVRTYDFNSARKKNGPPCFDFHENRTGWTYIVYAFIQI